jgi:hypothetical protein
MSSKFTVTVPNEYRIIITHDGRQRQAPYPPQWVRFCGDFLVKATFRLSFKYLLIFVSTFGKHEEALAAQVPHYDRHPRQAGREGELPKKKK